MARVWQAVREAVNTDPKTTYGIGNRRFLVKTMMEQLDITEEDILNTPTKDFVSLVRQKKLDKLI